MSLANPTRDPTMDLVSDGGAPTDVAAAAATATASPYNDPALMGSEGLVTPTAFDNAAIVMPTGCGTSRPITRRIHVEFDNTHAGLAQNAQQATYTVLDHDIWRTTRKTLNSTPTAERQGDISRVMLLGVKVKKVHSTFPCQLGVTMTGVKGNFYTCDGDRFAYMVAPNETRYDANDVIMATDTAASTEFMRLYPETTRANLRTKGIIKVDAKDEFRYVAQDHPIVEVMAANQEELQVNLADARLVDGRFLKVATPVVERCLTEIEDNVLAKLPVVDFGNFGVKIQRLYGQEWTDKAEVCDGITDPHLQKAMMEQVQRRLGLTLEVSYMFPGP